ncbi:glycoside hydrolase family 1 protein [Streptomyces sp. NPDC005263]|uniref:glycoside hydrolase family 1 protein n=1 Tax=Streptomyces sp. NPDC005263 TaxID=3364711 RepID=UPI0036BEEBDA
MLHFPDGFLWGAATAAHQIEGNNVNSDWWPREHAGDTSIAEPSGDACDSYHRYREDMTLLRDAGLGTYRFSIEWSRIEPEEGHVSRAAVAHYRRMVDTALDLGVTPMVTLTHFTVPRWFAEEGMWRSPKAADRFARFTELALPVLGDDVKWVCTLNEPNIAAMIAGGEDPANLVAHALPKPDLQVADTLLECHRRSRDVLSGVGGIRSGWTVATQAFQAEPGCEDAARTYGYPRDDWYLEAAAGDDWVGVQAYTRTVIGPGGPRQVPEGTETTLTGWEYYPQALELGVRSAWEKTGGVPVFVTENGIATADDTRRIDYTRGALTGLHAAIEDGVQVEGYLHWSLLDNYEWASGYRPTFGLIAVNRETFVRTPKRSLGWLGQVAAANAIDPHQS